MSAAARCIVISFFIGLRVPVIRCDRSLPYLRRKKLRTERMGMALAKRRRKFWFVGRFR
jgi:hypothetical protein